MYSDRLSHWRRMSKEFKCPYFLSHCSVLSAIGVLLFGSGGIVCAQIADNAGHISASSATFDVTVSGRYAYLANYDDGVRIYDVSDPANPTNVAHINSGGFAHDVAISGSYAFVANTTEGLQIYDISSPASPITLGPIKNWASPADFFRVSGSGGYVYLASGQDGLRIYNVSGPKVGLIKAVRPFLFNLTPGTNY